MSMSFKASPDGTFGEILVNGQVVAKLPVTGNAVIPNLVGTVSQSGGVPTGAVVERGSNANGEYVRFADGTQICAIFKTGAELNITTAIGSIFYEPVAIGNYVYPAAFSGQLPKISFSNWVGNGLTQYTAGSAGSLTTTPLGYFSSPSAQPLVTMQFFHVIAIGRWF